MGFLEYFDSHVSRLRFADKKKSLLMKIIKGFIAIGNFLRICGIKNFDQYTTTIGHAIYESPPWEWTDSFTIHKAHELTHVMQFNIWMAIKYICSAKWRMYYESECVQTELIFAPLYKDPFWISRKVENFKEYGIPEKIILDNLHERIREYENKKLLENPQKVLNAYLDWANKV